MYRFCLSGFDSPFYQFYGQLHKSRNKSIQFFRCGVSERVYEIHANCMTYCLGIRFGLNVLVERNRPLFDVDTNILNGGSTVYSVSSARYIIHTHTVAHSCRLRMVNAIQTLRINAITAAVSFVSIFLQSIIEHNPMIFSY